MDFHIPPDLIRGPEMDFIALAGEVNWGIETLHVNLLRDSFDGAGVIAGIVDTGVDRTHPLLSNCVSAKDFTGSPVGDRDRNEHGTHCTGTVGATDQRIGIANGCKTVHGKALGDGGSGAGTWIRDAMQWCFDQGATIISMSLGSSSEDTTITAKMRTLSEQGAWIVCAAGNSGGNTPNVDWPGRSPYGISVAAIDSALKPASFSSAGAKIDTSGPGVNIWSTRPGGGFRQMSGTSMATPFIAGLLTCYRSGLVKLGLPIPKVEELRELLFKRSTDTHTPGDDNRTGPGWLSPILLNLNLTPDPLPVGGGS